MTWQQAVVGLVLILDTIVSLVKEFGDDSQSTTQTAIVMVLILFANIGFALVLSSAGFW